MRPTRLARIVPVLAIACVSPVAQAGVAEARAKAVAVAAREFARVASTCLSVGALKDAERACRHGLVVAPGHARLHKIRASIPSDAERKQNAARRVERTRTRAEKRIGKALLEYASKARSDGDVEGLWEALSWNRWLLSEPAPDGRYAPVWIPRLFRWVDGEAARRIQSGLLYVEGQWLEKSAVHARTDTARRLRQSFLVHERGLQLNSTLPVFLGLGMHNLAVEYVKFFRALVGGSWRLRPPVAPIRVFLLRTDDQVTQAHAMLKLRQLSPGSAGQYSALAESGGVDPSGGAVFIKWDERAPSGLARADALALTMQHELTHLLAFTMSNGPGTLPKRSSHYWVVEGLAAYMEGFQLRSTGWESRHVHKNPAGTSPGPLGHIYLHYGRRSTAPPLEALLGLSHGDFVSGSREEVLGRYAHAATFVHFLFSRRATRSAFFRLCDVVHSARPPLAAVADLTNGVAPKQLDAQFSSFVESLQFLQTRHR